jgi:hypothetical protein
MRNMKKIYKKAFLMCSLSAAIYNATAAICAPVTCSVSQSAVTFKVLGYCDTTLCVERGQPTSMPNALRDQYSGEARWRSKPDTCKSDNISASSFSQIDAYFYIADSVPQKYIEWTSEDTVRGDMTLVSLYKPYVSARGECAGNYFPKPEMLVVDYGNPVNALTINAICHQSGTISMDIRMMTKVYPQVKDSYDHDGTPYPIRLQPQDAMDTLCFCRFDGNVKLTVAPAAVELNAKTAILLKENNVLTPPPPYTSVDNYMPSRYELRNLPSISNLAQAFTTAPTVKLKNEQSGSDKYTYYKDLPVGLHKGEVQIANTPATTENYQLNPSFGAGNLYITQTNWRGYRETLTYGDTLRLDATYPNNGTNLLSYRSSNTNVLTITRQGVAWTAKIKSAGNVNVTIIYPGMVGRTTADTVVYPIKISPYRGLRIAMYSDTAPKFDPDMIEKYTVTGLRYDDKITSSELGINIPGYDIASGDYPTRQGTYPIIVSGYNNPAYLPIDYVNGSLTIFQIGDSLQNVKFIRNPLAEATMGEHKQVVMWAKAVGNKTTNKTDTINTRPLRFSSTNSNVASILRDTSFMDSSDIHNPQLQYGAILQINNVGTTTIRAYQRGDSIYKDTFATTPLSVVPGNHSIYWLQRPDTLSVNQWIILSDYVVSTAGLPVEFSVDNKRIAYIGGDTLYALTKGSVNITARLPQHPNWKRGSPDTLTTLCTITSDYFEITVHNEALIPPFKDTTHRYTILLPCKDRAQSVYATIRVLYNSDLDELYLNDNLVDSTDNFRISENTPVGQWVFSLRRGGVERLSYTIDMRRRINSALAQLWEENPLLVLDLKKLTDTLNFEIQTYQWYYSISPSSVRYPLRGSNQPYLELAKMPYTSGYYSVDFSTADSTENLVTVCPFQIKSATSKTTTLKVFPNPVKDAVTIDNPSWETVKSIQVYDLRGNLVRQYGSSAERQTLDISNIPRGVYLIRAGTSITKITIL